MPDPQEPIESAGGSAIDMGDVITSLAATEDDLLACLVPAAEQNELYSFDGIVARGREIFQAAFSRFRTRSAPSIAGKRRQWETTSNWWH